MKQYWLDIYCEGCDRAPRNGPYNTLAAARKAIKRLSEGRVRKIHTIEHDDYEARETWAEVGRDSDYITIYGEDAE